MPTGFVFRLFVLLCLLSVGGFGCGSTQQREATEQLMTSDAVDRSVAQMDFRALSGKKVFFDTAYIKNVKGAGFVNAEYIISSLRQQMVAARCLLQDKQEDADYIVEARIGTLGTDRHEVTYGIPANNVLTAASSYVPNAPPLPSLPELSLAKRNEQLAAAKIGAFAYHRETREPVWQSGVSAIRSTTKDTWILGAGPFQRGDIYGGTQFAGTKLEFPMLTSDGSEEAAPLVDYNKPATFNPVLHAQPEPEVKEQSPVGKPKAKADTKPKVVEKPKPIPKTIETSKPVSNPLQAKSHQDKGLKLRLHFDQPPTDKTGTLFPLHSIR